MFTSLPNCSGSFGAPCKQAVESGEMVVVAEQGRRGRRWSQAMEDLGGWCRRRDVTNRLLWAVEESGNNCRSREEGGGGFRRQVVDSGNSHKRRGRSGCGRNGESKYERLVFCFDKRIT